RLYPDGSLDDTLNPGTDGDVRTLAVQTDGKLVVGGTFTVLGDETHDNIGRVNADGTVDSSFIPVAGAAVRALAVQADGKIIAGGLFTTLDGNTLNHIGR